MLMFLLSKLETIFFIITTFGIMQYKFRNGAMLEVPKKLIIVATNSLVCYLIIKVSYINLILITKLIILGIKFKVLEGTSFASDGITKLKGKIKSG